MRAGTAAHPELAGVFLFWACGQIYAVPNTIHSDFLTYFGRTPGALTLGVTLVLLFTVLFAVVLPGTLWTAFCVAVAGDEDSAGDPDGVPGEPPNEADLIRRAEEERRRRWGRA